MDREINTHTHRNTQILYIQKFMRSLMLKSFSFTSIFLSNAVNALNSG